MTVENPESVRDNLSGPAGAISGEGDTMKRYAWICNDTIFGIGDTDQESQEEAAQWMFTAKGYAEILAEGYAVPITEEEYRAVVEHENIDATKLGALSGG